MFAALMIGGMALGAYGQYKQGQAAEAAGRYNAKRLKQRAQLTEQAMESETRRSRDEARRLKASQLAGFAKSGARVDVGTPLLVMAEQAGDMERDILNQRRNRQIEIQGLRSGADMTKFGAKQTGTASKIGTATTLLGGATRAGSIYAGRSKTGAV